MRYLFDSIKNPKYQKYYLNLNINQDEKKQQKLVGRLLLSELIDVPSDKLINDEMINFDQLGHPTLNNKDTFFSISHSNELVIVVISDEEVGVDLEKIRPFSFHKIKRAFTNYELEYLQKNPKQTIKLWTIKEAVLKLLGVGIMGRPQSVEISLPDLEKATRQSEIFIINYLSIQQNYICTIVQKKHRN